MAAPDIDAQPHCSSHVQSLTPISLEFPPDFQSTEYHRPHIDLEKVCKDINDAVKTSFPTPSTQYDAVYVLLLRWEEDDLGTAGEIQELQDVFRNKYHFETESWEIPSVGAYNRLSQKVLDFQKDKSKRDLLILYYGGHAVGKPKSRDSVWTARRQGSLELPWSGIQSILLHADCDVLFILDCCYASRNELRDSVEYDGSKEVLAACSMEDKTTGVGHNSFTRRLIEELEKSREAREASISAWQLSERLNGRRIQGELVYTPRFFGLSKAKYPCIELRPMTRVQSPSQTRPVNLKLKSTSGDTFSDDSLSTISTNDWYTRGRRILVSINLVDWTKLPPVMQWERWLTKDAPENIKSLKLFYQPEAIREPITPEMNTASQSNVPAFLDSTYVAGDRFCDPRKNSKPQNQFPINSEAMYESDSTLLLLSLPLPIWKYLQHDPAYQFVGVVRSQNLLHRALLSRTPSISEKVEKGLTKASRQWWWYKWYVGFLITVGLGWNLLNIWRLGKSVLLLSALFSTVLGALPPLSLLTFEDSFTDSSDPMWFSGTPSFREPTSDLFGA